jgi:hypothetical protein
MTQKTYLIGLALLGSLVTLAMQPVHGVSANPSPQILAQSQNSGTCTDLLEVTTGQTQIRKQIRFSLLGPGNIHVDFAVPPAGRIDYYEVQFIPENDAVYQVDINFRYPDGSQANVFSARGEAVRNQTYSRQFVSPTGERPFLINSSIGGDNNTAYTVGVRGCRNQP